MPKKKITVPYHKVFPVLTEIRGVECWNFITDETFSIPAGLLLRLDGVNDARHTTVCIVDAEGNAPGIELTYTPTFFPHIKSTHDRTPIKTLGYRFIVENQALSAAIGIPMPKTTPDLVGDIIAYETGKADTKTEARLFRNLRRSGIGSKLQGRYSSRM